LPVCRISSAVHSTTLPPLQVAVTPEKFIKFSYVEIAFATEIATEQLASAP
jgi:hypothetical protein